MSRYKNYLGLEDNELEVDKEANRIANFKKYPKTLQVLNDVTEKADEDEEVEDGDGDSGDDSEMDSDTSDESGTDGEDGSSDSESGEDGADEASDETGDDEAPADEDEEDESPEPKEDKPAKDSKDEKPEKVKEEKPEADEDEEESDDKKDDKEKPEEKEPVEEVVKEGEETAEKVADAKEAVATLESIANSLSVSLDTGGMSPSSIKMLRLKMESYAKEFGYKKEFKYFPATEDFASVNSRILNTQLALESITDFIKRMWQAIIDALHRFIEWIKKFVMSFFDTFAKYKKSIKNLREALTKVKSGAPKEGKYENVKVIEALTTSDFFTRELEWRLTENMITLNTFINDFFGFVKVKGIRTLRDTNSVLKVMINGYAEAPDYFFKSEKLYEDFLKPTKNLRGFVPPNENLTTVWGGDILFGNVVLMGYLPIDGLDAEPLTEAINKSKVFLGSIFGNNNTISVDYMNPDEISALLDSMEVVVEKGLEARTVFEIFIQEKYKAKSLMETLSRKLPKEKDEKKFGEKAKTPEELRNKFIRSLTARLGMIDSCYVLPATQVSKLLDTAMRGCLDYAGESIRAYS